MSKLKLHMEDLHVESFTTEPRAPRPGTVFAHATVAPEVTCEYSCAGDCFATFGDTDCDSCWNTCERTCRGNTCPIPSQCITCHCGV